MEPELIKIGTLVELSTMKFGKLKTKVKDENGNKTDKDITYRAFQAKDGSPIFLGKSLKEMSDEKILEMKDQLIVGKIKKNLVCFKDAWEWE